MIIIPTKFEKKNYVLGTMAASLRVLKTIIRPRISETVIKYNILNANKLWTNNLITNSRQLSYSYRSTSLYLVLKRHEEIHQAKMFNPDL